MGCENINAHKESGQQRLTACALLLEKMCKKKTDFTDCQHWSPKRFDANYLKGSELDPFEISEIYLGLTPKIENYNMLPWVNIYGNKLHFSILGVNLRKNPGDSKLLTHGKFQTSQLQVKLFGACDLMQCVWEMCFFFQEVGQLLKESSSCHQSCPAWIITWDIFVWDKKIELKLPERFIIERFIIIMIRGVTSLEKEKR